MHIPKFLARINDQHEPIIFERFKRTYSDWLSGFKPDTVVSIVIRRDSVKKIRSLKANNYYWGVVIRYSCESLGYEQHEANLVHEGFKMKFLSQEHIIGLPITRSTATMTSDEFWDYIEVVRRFMSQTFNCVIPDPNQIAD